MDSSDSSRSSSSLSLLLDDPEGNEEVKRFLKSFFKPASALAKKEDPLARFYGNETALALKHLEENEMKYIFKISSEVSCIAHYLESDFMSTDPAKTRLERFDMGLQRTQGKFEEHFKKCYEYNTQAELALLTDELKRKLAPLEADWKATKFYELRKLFKNGWAFWKLRKQQKAQFKTREKKIIRQNAAELKDKLDSRTTVYEGYRESLAKADKERPEYVPNPVSCTAQVVANLEYF